MLNEMSGGRVSPPCLWERAISHPKVRQLMETAGEHGPWKTRFCMILNDFQQGNMGEVPYLILMFGELLPLQQQR